MAASKNSAKLKALEPVSNDGAEILQYSEPYIAEVTIEGTAPILFHAWSVESIDTQSNAPKGSKGRKTDNVESYVFRNEKKELCIPGRYLRGSIINAARFKQDPRSPRKSAADLYRAGVIALDQLATLGVKTWDHIDQQRAVVGRAGITRRRPALDVGWRATFKLEILLPEYISPHTLNEVIGNAGKLIGLADYRPSYGRFAVVSFKVL